MCRLPAFQPGKALNGSFLIRRTRTPDPLLPITVLRQHGCNQVRPVIQAWLRVVSSFEEFGHARNPNFLAMHLEQPAIRQVVQNSGKVFLGDVEA